MVVRGTLGRIHSDRICFRLSISHPNAVVGLHSVVLYCVCVYLTALHD